MMARMSSLSGVNKNRANTDEWASPAQEGTSYRAAPVEVRDPTRTFLPCIPVIGILLSTA